MIKYRRKWNYRKNNHLLILLIVSIVCCVISIGYGMLMANVGVQGTIQIGELRWTVGVLDESINYVDGTQTNVNTFPPTSGENVSLSYNINLPDLGDYYEFSFTVYNSGTIPAKLNEIVNNNTNNYVTYTYKYRDNSLVNIGDCLKPGEGATVIVRITFDVPDGATPQDLEGVTTNFNNSIEFKYNQVSPNDVTTSYVDEEYLYTRSTSNSHATVTHLENDITSSTDIYDTYKDLTYPNAYCLDNTCTWGNGGDTDIISLTIPVKEGDHVLAYSMLGMNSNGSTTTDGVPVTYLMNDTVVSYLDASTVYTEYTTNGYLTIPSGVNTINIPFYSLSNNNYLKILNP